MSVILNYIFIFLQTFWHFEKNKHHFTVTVQKINTNDKKSGENELPYYKSKMSGAYKKMIEPKTALFFKINANILIQNWTCYVLVFI